MRDVYLREISGVVLGRCAVLAIFWVVWMERNRRDFIKCKGRGIGSYGRGFSFWHHYGLLLTPVFKEFSVSLISLYWNVVVL